MYIGIDIGGSHIGIGAVTSDGKIQKKYKKYTTGYAKHNMEKFIEETIISVLERWEKEEHFVIEKIGIGVPGIVQDNQIKYSVNLGLYNYDLKSKIQNAFPNVNIQIKNDAKCAALAEKNIGALRDFGDCVFICIGTGIGGAVFYNGKLLVPKNGPGFEFGHMILKKNGRLCRCGSRGCLEAYSSMRSLKKDIKSKLNIDNYIEGRKLHSCVVKNLDNEDVKEVIDCYIDNLCVGISNIIDIFEPEAICIGGGFVNYKDILLSKLKSRMRSSNYIFYKGEIPEILTAKLGNDAGIIGSALFA